MGHRRHQKTIKYDTLCENTFKNHHKSPKWSKMVLDPQSIITKPCFIMFYHILSNHTFAKQHPQHSWAPRTNGRSWTIPLNILRLYFCGFMYGWFVPWWWPIQIIDTYGWYCLYVVGLVVDCLILMISMVYNSGSCRSRMDMFGIFVYLRYTLGIWLFIIPKCKTHME